MSNPEQFAVVIWFLTTSPELFDAYVGFAESRANHLEARIAVAMAKSAADSAAVGEAVKIAADRATCEFGCFLAFQTACKDALRSVEGDSWMTDAAKLATADLQHSSAAFDASLNAMEDAVFAAEDARAISDLAAVNCWREEFEKRQVRFHSLRRAFYQQRVLQSKSSTAAEN